MIAQNAAARYRNTAGTSSDTPSTVRNFAQREGLRFLLVNQQGEVLYDSESTFGGTSLASQVHRLQISGANSPSTQRPVLRLQNEGEDLMVTPLPIAEQFRRTAAGGDTALLVAVPTTMLIDTWIDLLPALLGTVVVTLVIAVALAMYLSRRLSEPLVQLAEAARQIVDGNYDTQVDIGDDTEIGELALALNTMTDEVRTAQNTQRELLTNISHDLRTPLTSIQGFSQALLDGTADTEEEREHVAQIIYEESSRLTQLIQQVLDLARIEAGTFSMAQEEADLNDVLDHLENRYEPLAEARGIVFDVHRPRKSLPIKGDSNRLEQALTNLLDNAFEHAGSNGRQPGEVRLAGTLGGVRGANGDEGAGGLLGRWWIELEVADNGPGLDGDDISYVFERFCRADEARSSGRAGLGLAIAREIVNAHGGDISVESGTEGTTFEVRLPMNMGF